MKQKMKLKCSTLLLSCLLFATLATLASGVPAAANAKRKSPNLLTDSGSGTSEASSGAPHQGDLIPIPDNLLKKPTPKKIGGKIEFCLFRF